MPVEDEQVQPYIGLPACPAFLTGLAKEKWEDLASNVTWFTQVDLDLVAAYCSLWERWRSAEKAIAETGPVVRSEQGGLYQNPYLSVANKALDQMTKLGALLGLNPKDRGDLNFV